MKYLQSAALCVGFIIAPPLAAADPPADDVDRLVRTEMQQQHIPGLALLVSRSGQPIRAEGYGLANVELQVAVGPATIFQSGSVGKQFTATAVMMLVEAGKVGLDDPLTRFFPQAPAWWKAVTVRELLSQADIIPNRSAGYRWVNGRLKNQEWVSPQLNTTADGSLYFSVLDLAKWDAALYTEKLLKRASMRQMWTVATLNDGKPNTGHYGYGWFIGKKQGHHVVEHEGQWQGFETQISRYVDDGLTVVVLTNLAEAKPERIADGVAAIYFSRNSPP